MLKEFKIPVYLPLKFPTNILIKILEEFHKNSAVIWLKDSDDIFSLEIYQLFLQEKNQMAA